MRYVFANPLDWPLDVSEFLLVGAVFLGGAYTLQVDGHVNISIFFMRLSSSKQLALKCLHYVIILIFSFILIWKGWELAWDNLHARTSSISLLPLFPSYMIVPIGGFFLFLQAVSKFIKDVFHKKFLDH
jgi:TRAP-type C4-dicarboxylate transport system permease small subunit